MCALTVIRKPGTDAAVAAIVLLLDSHRFDGADIAAVLYAAHEAMCDSEYQRYGSADIEGLADTITREIKAHATECGEQPSYWPALDLAFLNIRSEVAA